MSSSSAKAGAFTAEAANTEPHDAITPSSLSMRHAIAIIVGLVIGAGIFMAPSIVAASVPSVSWMFGVWIAGGVLSAIGALCYAELSSCYPSKGGEYHFLSRAFGKRCALIYAWARFLVITTGSIALLGFVFGDYMSRLLSLGSFSPAIYAALAVVLLTFINLRGIRDGAETQAWLSIVEVGGLILIVVAAASVFLGGGVDASAVQASAPAQPASPLALSSIGFAMVFVLLTFGGWNDAAYISADLKGKRSIVTALLTSIAIITVLYLLVNWAYWYVLGLQGMAKSSAVATDVLTAAFGDSAGKLIAAVIAAAALTSINATLIVGARTASALGNDWPQLKLLAEWDAARGVPRNSLIIQCVFALLLIALGSTFKNGFQSMVEFTAPVFWLFFLLVGLSVFRLRQIDAEIERPFTVPLYPVLPAIFCLSSAYMLWSSLSFVYSQQLGGFNAAWVGVCVLASGFVVLGIVKKTPGPKSRS